MALPEAKHPQSYIPAQLLLVVPLEGIAALVEVVQQHPQSPDVDLERIVHALLAEQLRSHIVRSTAVGLPPQHRCRKTEIYQLDRPTLADHYVIGLDIAMGDAVAVEVADRLRHPDCDLPAEVLGYVVGVVPEVLLEGGGVGYELEEDVDLHGGRGTWRLS